MIDRLNYKLTKRGKKFFIKNIEEKTILAIFTKVKIGEALTLGDKLVLEAFNRYSSSLSDLDTLKHYLTGLSDEQLMGVTSNVKGILHEIQFAAIENNNFDSVYASLYETTNHPGYDVRMFDQSTGEEWDIQLKATDNASYVEDWIEEHDGDIKVTEELAEKEGFESSGISNEELTTRVEEFIDAAISQGSSFTTTIFDYFPHVTALTMSVMIIQLYKRKLKGDIDDDKFKSLLIKNTGQKAVKIAGLMALLSIPGVNIATVGYLVYRFVNDLNKSGILVKATSASKKYYNKFAT
ncbi:hypothetical protein N9W04_02955 [Alphaproteobacteria bacterium]|nr:hypothetical protein [Alphaproteobacteria bacterium]